MVEFLSGYRDGAGTADSGIGDGHVCIPRALHMLSKEHARATYAIHACIGAFCDRCWRFSVSAVS